MGIDRQQLIQRVQEIEGLNDDERAGLLQLLHEQKKYGIVWEDKPEEAEQRLATELPVLTEVKERYIAGATSDAPNHILIEGDNLHALTALSYTHEGKIDVIYIDPPYNTGNKDFVYNDSYVDREDGYRHSKWLSFMNKRLKIAKRLLSDRGVIFISIDDNEQAQLKLLCDEVFGEENQVAHFIKPQSGGKSPFFVKNCHEYLLCYMLHSDNLEISLLNRKELLEGETSRSLRKDGDADRRQDRPDMYYCIYTDIKTGRISSEYFEGCTEIYPMRPDGTDGRWRWGKEKFRAEIDRLAVKKKKNGAIDIHVVVDAGTIREYPWESIIRQNTGSGGNSLTNILGDNNYFSYPKNVDYIAWILSTHVGKSFTILDFFAGSGTTLHATMQLNAEDGGRRQCILVTNNENGICENVTYEHNRRVIQGYTTPKGVEVAGLADNTLRYYRTDFVPNDTTIRNKRRLMELSTDMLCIKNNLYCEQEEFAGRKLNKKKMRYFTEQTQSSGNKSMLVVYDEQVVDTLVDVLAEMDVKQKIMIYVFSNTSYPHTDNFEEVLSKVELCALPSAILNAYRKITG